MIKKNKKILAQKRKKKLENPDEPSKLGLISKTHNS